MQQRKLAVLRVLSAPQMFDFGCAAARLAARASVNAGLVAISGGDDAGVGCKSGNDCGSADILWGVAGYRRAAPSQLSWVSAPHGILNPVEQCLGLTSTFWHQAMQMREIGKQVGGVMRFAVRCPALTQAAGERGPQFRASGRRGRER